ncbi:MAG: TetR/AcrR family transcriptional regulator [Nocardioidaceae bacterium]|nr:TetR/AcrR family transcriptional regulator [Nocardioidaceae bacterium]MCL2612005.1 TetR/AcrR family transcriptional regulator [Nocardioidaceae bacterium]
MRKQPRQARSKAMVERIIEAGRRVLTEEGYDALTTNRVAVVAEVSPGSLYQYFPDKTSILDEVIERYWDEVSERVTASLADRIAPTDDGDDLAAARAITDALLAALETDPNLLRVLSEELPAARNRRRRATLERRVRDLLSTYLTLRPEISSRPDPSLTAWVMVIALENLALRWVLDAPGFDRDRLLDEIVALVGGYLAS